MKIRFWALLMKALGKPRLTIAYSRTGWITLDQDDWLQRRIFYGDPYELEVWEALSGFADSKEILWDIGSHIGTFAIRALMDPRVKEIHVFEPDPIHAEVLEYNLALNKGRYRIHHFALGDTAGKAKLFHAELPNTGLSSLAAREGWETFEIESRTMDELVFERGIAPPTLLKIDVEGWENRVLKGGCKLLSERPPKALVIEGKSGSQGDLDDADIEKMLARFGYDIRWIRRPNGEIEPRENYLAVYKG